MTQQDLLDRLETELRELLEQVRTRISTLPREALLIRQNTEIWNVLECLAHLNAYTDHYLPHIERSIHKAKARKWTPGDKFRSTWFGRYSVNYVDPANLSTGKKRKASKRFNFLHQQVGDELKRFIISSERLLRCIAQAREIDLNKPRIPVAQFRLFKLNMGDLLFFLVTHNRRHVQQALRLVEHQR